MYALSQGRTSRYLWAQSNTRCANRKMNELYYFWYKETRLYVNVRFDCKCNNRISDMIDMVQPHNIRCWICGRVYKLNLSIEECA